MTRRLIVPLCFLPCCGSSDPGHKLALWWVGGWVGGSVLQDLLPCLSGQGAPAKSRLQLHPQGRPLSSWSLAFPGDLPGSLTGGQGVSVHPSEPAQLCSSEHTLLALGSSRIPAPDVPAGRSSPPLLIFHHLLGTCTACRHWDGGRSKGAPSVPREMQQRAPVTVSWVSASSSPMHITQGISWSLFPSPAFSPLVESWVH